MLCGTKLRNGTCPHLTRLVSILVPAAVFYYFMSLHVNIPPMQQFVDVSSAHFSPEDTLMVAGSWGMTAAIAREFQRNIVSIVYG
jgi:hypothetical protein